MGGGHLAGVELKEGNFAMKQCGIAKRHHKQVIDL
jgi:hypothetical protein